MIEKLLNSLSGDNMERLRWLVSRRLNIAPYGQSDEEVIKCALHLLLEQSRSGDMGCSAGFDEGRFMALKEAEYGA